MKEDYELAVYSSFLFFFWVAFLKPNESIYCVLR